MTLSTVILWRGYITKDAVDVFDWNFICNVSVNFEGVFWLRDLFLFISTVQLFNLYLVTL